MRGSAALAVLLGLLAAAPARADLVLSDLIVELEPGKSLRKDLEIWNDSPERSFVAVEPREIVDAALPGQKDRRDPDPQKLGLLVSPHRMILEPGQRKLIRIASLAADAGREHVYRVTVRPVTGEIESEDSGLKVLVGYDVLVLVRPVDVRADVAAVRTGRSLAFTNRGNVSVELVEGRQCAASGSCIELPGKRLYPGASWSVELKSDAKADYVLKMPGRSERKSY